MRSKHLQGAEMVDKVWGTLLINGVSCPVTNIFDMDGDDTDTIADAYSAVVQVPNGLYISVCVDQSGIYPLQ